MKTTPKPGMVSAYRLTEWGEFVYLNDITIDEFVGLWLRKLGDIGPVDRSKYWIGVVHEHGAYLKRAGSAVMS